MNIPGYWTKYLSLYTEAPSQIPHIPSNTLSYEDTATTAYQSSQLAREVLPTLVTLIKDGCDFGRVGGGGEPEGTKLGQLIRIASSRHQHITLDLQALLQF